MPYTELWDTFQRLEPSQRHKFAIAAGVLVEVLRRIIEWDERNERRVQAEQE